VFETPAQNGRGVKRPAPTLSEFLCCLAARAANDPAAVPALADLVDHVREYVRALPLRSGTTPLKFAPDYEKWLVEAISHGDDDAPSRPAEVRVKTGRSGPCAAASMEICSGDEGTN
jgi:hypothetical protein